MLKRNIILLQVLLADFLNFKLFPILLSNDARELWRKISKENFLIPILWSVRLLEILTFLPECGYKGRLADLKYVLHLF